jgi:hypothetical protein
LTFQKSKSSKSSKSSKRSEAKVSDGKVPKQQPEGKKVSFRCQEVY